MRQLTKTENIIFIIGAVLMVIGAGVSLTGWNGAAYIFSAGALAFSAMQMMQRYDGNSVTIRRLRRIMIFSDLLFMFAGLLMIASIDNAFGLPQITYLQYVKGKWVGMLMLAALIQIYVAHRLDHELKKEAKKL